MYLLDHVSPEVAAGLTWADGPALPARPPSLDDATVLSTRRIGANFLRVEMATPGAGALGRGAAVERVERTGREALAQIGFARVDYLEVREPETLAPVDPGPLSRPARLLAAALGCMRFSEVCGWEG